MTPGVAMTLPIGMAIVAVIFVLVLYYIRLVPCPVGPSDEKELTYEDPRKLDETGKRVYGKDGKPYPDDKCTIPKDEQIAIGKAMNLISGEVQKGATEFLKEEYKYLSGFVLFMAATLLVLFTLDDSRTNRTDGVRIAACFIIGAVLSASTGWIGMVVATDANVRTTQAARKPHDGGQVGGGLNNALRVAFTGGAVMGFGVVGLGLLGVSFMFWLMTVGRDSCGDYQDMGLGFTGATTPDSCISNGMNDSLKALAGFGFGASSIALFARVAGGIYTKAADVGADLVGKVEEDIPEDSPENPATIADNVGDNVGDVAGMGADLFESFVGSIIATATLANGDIAKVTFPFWLAAAGVLASIVGYFMVSIGEEKEYRLLLEKARNTEELQETMFEVGDDEHSLGRLKYPFFQEKDSNGKFTGEVWRYDQEEDPEDEKHEEGKCFVFDDAAQQGDLMMALHKGTVSSALLVIGFAAVECYFLFDYSDYQRAQDYEYSAGPEIKEAQAWRIFGCVIIGLLCGILIGLATEYCTSYSYYPVKSIAKSGTTGPATVIIQGLGVGMMSCFPPIMIIVATILSCNALMADYGVAVAAVSMLSTLGVTLATDAYGPVADNAGGLAEMVEELPSSVRATTDALDALGNTTAATGKGFAIGSAVLTSLSLLNAFKDRVTGDVALDVSVNDSIVLAGVVFGSMLPFLFGALTMISVGLAAQELIRAVREDFKIKKDEEAAAISASTETPYMPWKFTSLETDQEKQFEYYKKNFGGHADEEARQSGLAAQGMTLTDAGFSSVTLKNLIRKDGPVDPNQDNAHDVVEGGRIRDGGNDDVPLTGLARYKKDAASDGAWAERQSIFETSAWHGIRGWAPNSGRCIAISTSASIQEMLLPGVYAICAPVFVGFLVGARMLMGVLAGSVGAGAMMAIMMSNAGGAWDNSKKYIEIAGAHGGKGTEIHKACVVGDTVGDPFKDTSGPALNILLKLMAMVSLTIATLLKGRDDWDLAPYATIPGFVIIVATFWYCKYIYNQSEQATSDSSLGESPPSPNKNWFAGEPKIQVPVKNPIASAPAGAVGEGQY
jgi:Na+/H+-translocating membrane pyrophosphatase